MTLHHGENVMSCKLATCGKRDDQSTIGQLSSTHSLIPYLEISVDIKTWSETLRHGIPLLPNILSGLGLDKN